MWLQLKHLNVVKQMFVFTSLWVGEKRPTMADVRGEVNWELLTLYQNTKWAGNRSIMTRATYTETRVSFSRWGTMTRAHTLFGNFSL